MKKNLLFAILCVLGLFGTLNAQDVVTIDGTVGEHNVTTSKNVPAFCANKWAITQQYYLAAEIGKSSGTIEKIAFKTADVADEVGKYPFTRNLVVYMENTEDHTSTGQSLKAMPASSQVFSGEVTFAYNSWVTIDITDFEYTGQNVLICVNDITGSNVSLGISFDAFIAPSMIGEDNAYRALYKRSTSAAFDATTINYSPSKILDTPVPFVQFTFKSGTTTEYAEPSKPTNFTYTILNESKVQLSWNAAAETESYNVYEGSELIANVTETSYTVRNLNHGTHCFKVTGANGPKESEATEELCVNLVAKTVESITIGTTGEGDSFTAPMSLLNPGEPTKLDSWVEQIYTAAEIDTAFTIERISFPIKATGQYSEPFATKEIKIYLAETTKTDYANKVWTNASDLKLVYSDTDIIIGDQEWETFELDTPFNYSGTKNLAVVVAKSAEESSAQYLWHCNSVANSVLYTNETSECPTIEGNITTTRPVVRFSWTTGETEEVVLTAPANVVATPKSTSEIVLTWDAVEGATGYRVYQGEIFSNVTETTYTVEGLEYYKEYCFDVTAERNGEQETEKVTVCAKTLDLAIVAPVVTAEATSTSEIVLTWNAVENALSYNVYQGETLLTNVTELTYTVEGLASYTDYSFTVSAVRNEQEAKSSVTAAKTLDLTIVAPVVTAEATSASEITLTWNAVENALSYNVYQGETLLGNVTELTYTVEGLAPYTDYSFTVTALRNAQAETSEAATAKTLDLVIVAPAVTAEATSASEITLTWNAVENALSYNVYQGEEVVVEGLTTTTYTVEGLASYTDYSFTVSAVRNDQEEVSEAATAKTLDLTIEKTAGVTAAATGTTTIALTWETVTNALSYNVYYGDTVVNVTSTTYTVEGLEDNTDYCFNITAVRNEQETEKVEACAKTTEEIIPVAPTNVVATATSTSEIVLTWSEATNALSYNVYYGDTVVNVTETTYTVSGLELYTDYCFDVTSVREEKETEKVTACARTLDLTIAAPVVTAEVTSATEIVLTWEAVENAMSYVVYQGEDSIANITETTFTVEGLDPYTEYSFTVTALRNAQAETSAVVTAKTLDLTIAAPVVKAEATSATEIVLTWEAVENAMSYVVYQGEDSIANITETTFTVEGLDVYTEYSFTVTALRNAQAETSAVVTAKTLDLTIAAPVVAAEATSATEIVLTWEAVENAMSYVVYQGEDSIANVTETTFTVVDLDPETEYCFTVSALRNAQVETSEKACATTLVKKEIIIGDYPTTFFYDFENGNLNGWTVIDKNNDGIKWQFKDGYDGGMNDGKGVYSGALYGNCADDYLITASKYSMTETSEFSFVFVPYDCSTYFREKIAVVVSEDNETFETVWSYEFEESIGDWDTAIVNLKAYAGRDLYVGLYHYGSEDGIRVDNIKLDSKEPAVPANLTAEATPTSITLTWDVVANAASYNVYSVVGEDYTLVENVKKATYTAEGLDYETEYSYAVTSVNDYKESRYSKVIEVTTLGEPLPEGVEILLKETFEAYTAGDKIAEKGAEHWTTWSKKPGSAEDGIVAELDGNKYGHFTYGNDQVLRLGGYQAGVFELEFDVYVPEGKGGYYNLLHQFEGNTSWAVQAYFQMEEKDGQANPKIADGHGTVHAGSLNTYDVPCVYNDWMHFRIEINANIDEAVYHYTMPGGEEVEAFKWQWSKDCFGDGVVGRKLDAMGFFPPTKGTEFYVDNIILKRIGGESAPIITFNQEEVNGSMAGDDISSVELEIENIGTSIAEYVAWIDYGEGAMSDDYEIISYALEDLSTTTTIGWNPIEEPMTFEIAALYPSSAYAGSVMGTYISAASYFLGEFKTQDGNTVPMLEPGTDMIFRIYGQGINGKPGEVLAEKVLPADSIILDWNVVTFDEPVLLTGFDFYLAVEMTQCVGGSAMVLDGNKDGAYQGYADLCRQTSGTPFRSLTEFTQGEKFGNFHLMVLCMGDAVTGGWAELSKKDGTLEIGAKETIEINFTSIGLEEGKKYDAKIVFNTNTEEGVIELPLSLYVWGENVEEILSNTYNIYPNPTTAQVTVEGENIDYIAVYNSVGLLVKVVRTQNNIVDMSTNENGVYFFNIVDQDGQSSVQRVVVAK